MKTIINVECVDQNIMFTNAPLIASGGLHENYIKFNFCEKWNGISGIAVFYKNEKEKYYSLIDAENMCEIPHEVTDSEGIFFFGVFGTSGDETTKTTKILKYKVLKGAIVEDAQPSEPMPDIYEQLLAQYSYIIATQEEFLANQKAMMENYHDTWVERTEAFEKEIREQTNGYTDQKIAELLNGAPTTLDTLKEIADAMEENKEVVDALEVAIGNKATIGSNVRFTGISIGAEGNLSYIYADENDSIWIRCKDGNGNVSFACIPSMLESFSSLQANKADINHGKHVPDTCPIITDWNDAVTTGWYMGAQCANAPDDSWYMGYVIAHNTGYVIQEIYQFTTTSYGQNIPKFIRIKVNDTWGDWANISINNPETHDHYRLANNGYVAYFQNNGDLAIYNSGGAVIWSSYNSVSKSNFILSGTTLTINL